jgi:hypothetical protein
MCVGYSIAAERVIPHARCMNLVVSWILERIVGDAGSPTSVDEVVEHSDGVLMLSGS